MEMVLSSVIDTYIFKILKANEITYEIRALQCEVQRLKFQTMFETSKNVLRPSVTLFESGIQHERAGLV